MIQRLSFILDPLSTSLPSITRGDQEQAGSQSWSCFRSLRADTSASGSAHRILFTAAASAPVAKAKFLSTRDYTVRPLPLDGSY